MADQGFFDFELIPAEADEFSPDAELEAVNELLDDSAPADADADPDAQPIGRGWAVGLDGESGGSSPSPLYGHAEIVHIANVALRTPRGQYAIFPDDFGRDDPGYGVGQPDSAELRATLVRDCTECLLACHERITDVADIAFQRDPDEEELYMDVTIEIDGDENIRLESVPLYG